MQDTIIKGEGTSRSLKIPASKAVVYQDVSAMVQDMVSGNFLFDLGPIRLDGVTQKGTDLNKANLLSDATAALYGKGSNASPDEILALLGNRYIDDLGLLSGSYSGTGMYGYGESQIVKQDTPGIRPYILFIRGYERQAKSHDFACIYKPGSSKNGFTSYGFSHVGNVFYDAPGFVSFDGYFTLESTASAAREFNASSTAYYWTVLGTRIS